MKRAAWIVICIVVVLFALRMWNDNPTLFSSKSSPSGQWIAENYGYIYEEFGGGYIVIRRSGELQKFPHKLLNSKGPMPGLFFIWKDDSHLTITIDSADGALTGPSEYMGIHISYATYPATLHVANYLNKNSIIYEITPNNVTATFSEELDNHGQKMCDLVLQAVDGSLYDKIGITVDGSSKDCRVQNDGATKCGGFGTKFWVGKRTDGVYGELLTSSTVSNIPSYNRMPEGDGHTAIRGQFLEVNADKLLAEMQKESFDIEYSLNFFDKVITYRIPTQSISEQIREFKNCNLGR